MLFMSIGCALYEFVEENGIKVHSAAETKLYTIVSKMLSMYSHIVL